MKKIMYLTIHRSHFFPTIFYRKLNMRFKTNSKCIVEQNLTLYSKLCKNKTKKCLICLRKQLNYKKPICSWRLIKIIKKNNLYFMHVRNVLTRLYYLCHAQLRRISMIVVLIRYNLWKLIWIYREIGEATLLVLFYNCHEIR